MNYHKTLIPALMLCIVTANCVLAEEADDPNEQEQALTIALTGFDVNETTLKISWKIENNTDHDVWICDCLDYSGSNFEAFMEAGSHTLLIRRRLDVPSSAIWRIVPRGRYILLRPGENRTESIVLNLPVQSKFVYASPVLPEIAEHARSIALEIGFYDEDLPAMIRTILQEADKFNGTNFGGNRDIKRRLL